MAKYTLLSELETMVDPGLPAEFSLHVPDAWFDALLLECPEFHNPARVGEYTVRLIPDFLAGLDVYIEHELLH